jgi:hypothetical protein
MLRLFLRCVFFLAGIALLADVALPIRTEHLQIDRHTSRHESGRDGFDTSYEVHLVGGTMRSCSIGYSAYSSLKDGDSVDVGSTRLWRICVRIVRGDEVIQPSGYWWLAALLGGGILVAAAVGLLKRDGDDSLGIRVDYDSAA